MKPRPKKFSSSRLDATEIFDFEELREYDFGHVEIEEVQICEMGVKEVEGEIRYKSVEGFSLTSMEVEEKGDVVLANKNELEGGNKSQGDVVSEGEEMGDVEGQRGHVSKGEEVEVPVRVERTLS
jgi:hypothetical protein